MSEPDVQNNLAQNNLLGAEEVTTTTTTTRRIAASIPSRPAPNPSGGAKSTQATWQDPLSPVVRSSKARDQSKNRRTIATRQEILLAGPEATSGVLPLSGKELDKFRGPKEFMTAARQNLVPSEVGAAFAETFMHALKHREVAMLKVLLPYVFGAPPETEQEGMGDDAVKGLIGAILGGPSLPAKDPTRTKRKYTKRQPTIQIETEDEPIVE